MLEVHAILQRQRCNENITKKTGTLSDAYYLGEYVTLKFKFVPHSHLLQIDEIEYEWGEIDVFIAINNNETQLEFSFFWRKQQ